MLQAKQQKKIIDILKELPPERLDEVIDFAEYLKTREKPTQRARRKTRLPAVPIFHLGRIEKNAFDRDALYGEYLDRKFD